MGSKIFLMAALTASVAAMPGTRAAADFADGLVGGLVGGAVSGIIVNESAKARERKRTTTTTTTRPGRRRPACRGCGCTTTRPGSATRRPHRRRTWTPRIRR